MNRLQNKCLLASGTAHGVLLLVLFLAPAFVRTPPTPAPTDLPVLRVIPGRLVDQALYNSGNPPARAAAVVQPAPTPVVTPAPTPTPPPRPEPTPQREPERPAPQPEPAPRPPARQTPAPRDALTTTAPANTTLPKRQTPEVNRKIVIRGNAPASASLPRAQTRRDAASEERRRAEEAAQQLRGVQSELQTALKNLGESLSGETTIDIPGTGGEAYANYGQAIVSIYENAWIKPGGLEETYVVRATVVVARDGRVISSRITDRCRQAAVDRSVEEVLQRVRVLRPFPEGTSDPSRTFNIQFELKPSRFRG